MASWKQIEPAPQPELVKHQRRTDDDRIAVLNAKIEDIRERAVRKAARANPAVRQTTLALKVMERALESQPGERLGPSSRSSGPFSDQAGTATPHVEAAPEALAPVRKTRDRATTAP